MLCLLSLLLGVSYAVLWSFGYGRQNPGFTTLVILQLFTISILTAILGVIGEYVARVFDNVRHHPMSIIERTIAQSPQSAGLPAATAYSKHAAEHGSVAVEESHEPELLSIPLVGKIGRRIERS